MAPQPVLSRQQANVIGRIDARWRRFPPKRDDLGIDFPRISLPGDGKRAFKSKSLCNPLIELADLLMIAVEQRQKLA